MNDKEILNTKDVAEILGISYQTVRKECAEGRIPAVKVGRKYFVTRENLYKLLNGESKE